MNASSGSAGKSWYLVQCKSRQDERAEENLTRQGYVCYRPLYQRERLLRGQRQIIEESLFPGYLFIHISEHDNWGPLRSTRGVIRVVGFGNQPLSVNDCVIDRLKQHDNTPATEAMFTAGERVRIMEGPFSELEAIFHEMDRNERVVLLLNFLQREQRIHVPLANIGKV